MLIAVEDAEVCAGASEDGFDEFKAKAGKSVAMGHDNLIDASLHALFHHHGESFSLEVDSGSDVSDDFVIWELIAEELDLAREVVLLMRAGDTGVDDIFGVGADDALSSWTIVDDFRFFRNKGGDVVEALSGTASDTSDTTLFRPVAEGLVTDAKDFPCAVSWDKRRIHPLHPFLQRCRTQKKLQKSTHGAR